MALSLSFLYILSSLLSIKKLPPLHQFERLLMKVSWSSSVSIDHCSFCCSCSKNAEFIPTLHPSIYITCPLKNQVKNSLLPTLRAVSHFSSQRWLSILWCQSTVKGAIQQLHYFISCIKWKSSKFMCLCMLIYEVLKYITVFYKNTKEVYIKIIYLKLEYFAKLNKFNLMHWEITTPH